MPRPSIRRRTSAIPAIVTGRNRRGKFNAIKTVVGGIRFDSKREAARYLQLVASERAGEISDLRLQPVFVLHAYHPMTGERTAIGKYRADFTYVESRAAVVEDVKGMLTPIYRWKKKHLRAEYGIDIRET